MRAAFGRIAPAALTATPAAAAARAGLVTVLFDSVAGAGLAAAIAAGAALLDNGAEPAVSAAVAGDNAARGVPDAAVAAVLFGSPEPALTTISTSRTAHHSAQFQPVRRVGCDPKNCSVRATLHCGLRRGGGGGAPWKYSAMIPPEDETTASNDGSRQTGNGISVPAPGQLN